ncbi:hypothetical protein [Sphaerisporangium aureirubrum]|uniref:XRE family transcriptional regulator n=1 Tax=Sphaerisporangium aureirubrum TaxID=1544736 RepID=A0ABW1NMH8_9ACTN
MTDKVPVWAARLRARRRFELWSQKDLVRELVETAAAKGVRLPQRASLLRMLKEWESGRRRPQDPYPVLLSRIFRMSEDELFSEGLLPGEREPRPAERTPAHVAALPVERSRHVAPELVDYFRLQLLSHYAADAFLGPRHLIGPVASQYRTITELAGQADGEVRRELLRLGAGYAAFAGWLYQDSGVADHAEAWLNLNLEMAHRAEDVQLVAHALTNKAMLATDLGDAATVIDLTGAVLADPRPLMNKTRILALQQAAHGYALAADRARCDALLDEAATLADQLEDDDRMWGNACRTPNYVEIQRATCYGRLGLTSGALTLWDQILPAMPPSARRDIGVFLARQAAALAAVPDPEWATVVVREAMAHLHRIGSVRQRAALREIPARMGAWADSTQGRVMTEMLAGALSRSPDARR